MRNICSVTLFHNSLRNPDMLLRTIRDVTHEPETLSSTRYFAECRGRIDGYMVMMYAPITPQSMDIAEHAIEVLRSADGSIGTMEIMRDEIICCGGQMYYCDLIVERLHMKGIALSEAIHTLSHSTLMRGLDKLRDTLKRHNISHNHLSVDNIIVDRQNYTWHPLHSYYADWGYGGDSATLDHIASLIKEYSLPDIMPSTATALHDNMSTYSAGGNDTTKRYPMHERRRRVTTQRGTGFENEKGEMVIKDVYLRASDFEEDRATVVTHNNKVGLFDRQGRFIIKPIYDDIVFSVDDGTSRAVQGKESATFDYFGNQLTEWRE